MFFPAAKPNAFSILLTPERDTPEDFPEGVYPNAVLHMLHLDRDGGYYFLDTKFLATDHTIEGWIQEGKTALERHYGAMEVRDFHEKDSEGYDWHFYLICLPDRFETMEDLQMAYSFTIDFTAREMGYLNAEEVNQEFVEAAESLLEKMRDAVEEEMSRAGFQAIFVDPADYDKNQQAEQN